MSNYVDNIYNKYLSQEWSKKFQCSGVYSISINNKIVYVGKSMNILHRMAEHWASMTNPKENKYKVLSEAKRRKMIVSFDVLYSAKNNIRSDIEEEIGEREGYYIRKFMPSLNYQIPNQDDWRKFTTQKGALNISLDEIMKGENYDLQ